MSEPLNGAFGPQDQWDVPLGGLPTGARVRFDRTHLEAAVAEVRFVNDAVALDRSVAVHVWEALGTDIFPRFEPTQQHNATIELGPDGVEVPNAAQSRLDGWQLVTANADTSVMLLPTAVVVQTRSYERYRTSLAKPLETALAAFVEATGLGFVQRLGLRYINRLTDEAATAPQFWQTHLRPAFAGPLEGLLGELVTNVHQQVEFVLDETASARVQSGAFEDQPSPTTGLPLYSYLIDLDVYREQASIYEPAWIANQLRQLNRTSVAMFASVLTDQYLDGLGPTPLAPSDRETMSETTASTPPTQNSNQTAGAGDQR